MKIYHTDYDSVDFDHIDTSDVKDIIRNNVRYKDDLYDQTKELKKIKFRLEKMNDRFFNAFKELHLGAVIFRKVGNDYYLIDFNKKSVDLDNLTDADKGKKVTEVYPNINDFGILDVFDGVLETGTPEKHHNVYDYDGVRKGVRNSYIYRLSDNRNEIMGVYEDISNVVQIEETFNTIFELSQCPICVLTLKDYVIVDANEAFIKYVDYDKSELVGNSLFKNNIIYEVEDDFLKELRDTGEVKEYFITGIDKNDNLLEGYVSAKFIVLNDTRYLLAVILPEFKKEFYDNLKKSKGLKKEKSKNRTNLYKGFKYGFYTIIIFLFSFLTVYNYNINRRVDYNDIYTEYYNIDDAKIFGITRGGSLDNELTNGILYYQEHRYEDAISTFKGIKNDNTVNYYIALSYMELNDFDKSAEYFGYIIEHRDNLLVEKAQWLSVLCYVKMNEKSKAIKILEDIVKTNHYKLEDAKELLEVL